MMLLSMSPLRAATLGIAFFLALAEARPAAAEESFVPRAEVVEAPESAELSERASRLLQVEGSAFYNMVGRADLAVRYESRRRTKNVVRIFGVVGVGAGLYVAAVVYFLNSFRVEGPTCEQAHDCVSYAVPGLITAVGLGLLLTPSAVPSDPVSDSEKIDLARAAAARTWPPLPRFGMSLTPTPDGGASVAFAGRF
jgi:hypothetical protein